MASTLIQKLRVLFLLRNVACNGDAEPYRTVSTTKWLGGALPVEHCCKCGRPLCTASRRGPYRTILFYTRKKGTRWQDQQLWGIHQGCASLGHTVRTT